jgi:hypothetical protein
MRILMVLLAMCSIVKADIAFNNLGAGDSFDTGAGYAASGFGSSHGPEWSACQFISAASGILDRVTIPIGYVSGSNSFNITLHQDNAGQLGNGLIEWGRSAPSFGSSYSPLVLTNPFPSVTLSAGTAYWIAVRPGEGNAYAIWNFNSQGDLGPRLNTTNDGDSFTFSANDLRGAMRIETVPEPTPLAMVGFGLLALWRGRSR